MSVVTESRVTGIEMTGYMVKDTERALAFYRDVLGLEPTTEHESPICIFHKRKSA